MTNSLQQFKDQLTTEIYGQTAEQSQAKGLCIQCKEPARTKCYSSAGLQEYAISGLCEQCFGSICNPEEEPS